MGQDVLFDCAAADWRLFDAASGLSVRTSH